MWWPLSYGFLWLLTRNEACQFQPHIIWVKPHLHPYADSNCWCRNVQPAGAWYAGDGWEFWAAPAALKVVTESLLVPMIRAIVDEQINQTKEENNLNIFQNILVIYRHIVVNRQPVFGLPIFLALLVCFWWSWTHRDGSNGRFIWGCLLSQKMTLGISRNCRLLRGCSVVSWNLSPTTYKNLPISRICHGWLASFYG